MWSSLDETNQGGKTHPKREQDHPMGCSPGLNERKVGSDQQPSLPASWLCTHGQLPPASVTMLPHHDRPYLQTVSQEEPFLPQVALVRYVTAAGENRSVDSSPAPALVHRWACWLCICCTSRLVAMYPETCSETKAGVRGPETWELEGCRELEGPNGAGKSLLLLRI